MGLTPLITWAVIDPVMRAITTETQGSSAVERELRALRLGIAVKLGCRLRASRFDTAVMLRHRLRTLRLGIAVMLGRKLRASRFDIIVMLRRGLRALCLAVENTGFELCKTRASNSAS